MAPHALRTGLKSLDELLGGGLPDGGVVGIVGPKCRELTRQIVAHIESRQANVTWVDVDQGPWSASDLSYRGAATEPRPSVVLLVGDTATDELRAATDLTLLLDDWDPDLPLIRRLDGTNTTGPCEHLGWLEDQRQFVSLELA